MNDQDTYRSVVEAYSRRVDASCLLTLRDIAVLRANNRIMIGLYGDLTISLIKFAFKCQLRMVESAPPGSALSRKLGSDPARLLMFYVETYAELIDSLPDGVFMDESAYKYLDAMFHFTTAVERIRKLANIPEASPIEKRLAEIRESLTISWAA